MDGRCIIFAGGPLSECDRVEIEVRADDFVIACDAGYAAARHFGILPHLAVGDFDSYHGKIDPAVEVLTVPAKKDDTDTMLGIRIGLERGYRDFILIGAFGGRLDHTIANLQALGFLCDQGAAGMILSNGNRAWAVKDGTIAIERIEHHHISVFALSGQCRGVTLSQMAYALLDYTMSPTFPIGVSNEFDGDTARITVKEGTLLIIASEDTATQK